LLPISENETSSLTLEKGIQQNFCSALKKNDDITGVCSQNVIQ
jgi:hypothetical protein